MPLALKRFLGYTLFLIVIGCFFLYLFFPSDTVHEYIEASVVKISPELSLDVGRIHPALPFGIALEDVQLHHQSKPRTPVFLGDIVTLSPSIGTIIELRPIIRFSCTGYGGHFDGVFSSPTFALDGPFETRVQLAGVRLEQYGILRESLKRRCTGAISGSISFAFDRQDPLSGSGRADLSISNGAVHFGQPLFGLERLNFNRIDTRMEMEDRLVVFDTLTFQGEALDAQGEGNVRLSDTVGRSRLNLTVRVDPKPELWETDRTGFNLAGLLRQQTGSGRFAVSIYGTVAQPRLRLP